MKSKLIYLTIFILLFSSVSVLAAQTSYLHNDMPDYLQDFKKTVARQARKYPDSYFLSEITDKKIIALTFDDGPDSKNTPRLLNILKEEDVKATFFVLGEKAKKLPELTKRIVEEGHQIANHSWSHPDFREMSNPEIMIKELAPTSEIIERLTSHNPEVIRPPYGAVTDENIEFLAASNWKIINWSIDSFDWDKKHNSPSEIKEKIKKYHHPGAIVLMHCGEGREGTVKALPDIITFLRNKGYQFKTVNELLKLKSN